jgi:O-acetyl-ADP-ribose deacetylase (regulator of RNase III)
MLRNVWLVHPEEPMCEAFRVRFSGLPGVRVIQGRFEDLEPHDCFVTAGNAFGMMTAGIDAALVRFFGEQLMERVQYRIMDQYLGEQPVGTAFIEPTGNDDYPFIAHAPTMRVPGSIDGTDKVYSATWAALCAIHLHNVAPIARSRQWPCPRWAPGSVAFCMGKPLARWRRHIGIT